MKKRNSVYYTVNVNEQLWHRHIDHLQEREQDEAEWAEDTEYFPNSNPDATDDKDRIPEENAPNPIKEQQPLHNATPPPEDQATVP